MSFLESLGLDVIKSEKDMLRALRYAAEGWYNELTQPFLPVFLAHERHVPREEERTRLAKLANDTLCAELLINRGDALENKLAEIEKPPESRCSRGARNFGSRLLFFWKAASS